jgi:DMSO/TMAO reductase YedYZ molybdopterin-dependent catalytic subunit
MLHNYNVSIIALTAVTGVLLFLPQLRGLFSPVRVSLFRIHAISGLVLIPLLILYIPFLNEHWQHLSKKIERRVNLALVIFVILGWITTGLLVWVKGYLSPTLVQTSLLWHDILTLAAVPLIGYHIMARCVLARSRVLNQRAPEYSGERALEHPGELGMVLHEKSIPRRRFLRWIAGALVLAAAGAIVRWQERLSALVSFTGRTQLDEECGKMKPLPQPAAKSKPPVGGGRKGDFRVYTVTEPPCFDNENWKFAVSGLVDKPLSYTWEEFQAIPRQVQVSDFHCITGWSVLRVTYEGIPLSQFLDMAGVRPDAKFVKLYSGDGVYTDALSLEQARLDDVIVAVLMDGELLPVDYGGPARLIVPKMYAYKSVKWLVGIELIEEPHEGYWEKRGYDTDAWVEKS